MDNLKVGDILVWDNKPRQNYRDEMMILAATGRVVMTSAWNNFDMAGQWRTPGELKRNWKLKDE